MNEADEVLTITYYRSSVLNSLYPQVKDVNDFLAKLDKNSQERFTAAELSAHIKSGDKAPLFDNEILVSFSAFVNSFL